eukprot:m.30773 g.30773  ORF g.30773 m.30773 type:complete len:331 (+) comp31393_c0_seq2:15-1007(+)
MQKNTSTDKKASAIISWIVESKYSRGSEPSDLQFPSGMPKSRGMVYGFSLWGIVKQKKLENFDKALEVVEQLCLGCQRASQHEKTEDFVVELTLWFLIGKLLLWVNKEMSIGDFRDVLDEYLSGNGKRVREMRRDFLEVLQLSDKKIRSFVKTTTSQEHHEKLVELTLWFLKEVFPQCEMEEVYNEIAVFEDGQESESDSEDDVMSSFDADLVKIAEVSKSPRRQFKPKDASEDDSEEMSESVLTTSKGTLCETVDGDEAGVETIVEETDSETPPVPIIPLIAAAQLGPHPKRARQENSEHPLLRKCRKVVLEVKRVKFIETRSRRKSLK